VPLHTRLRPGAEGQSLTESSEGWWERMSNTLI
jgi:hypothetical protein